MKVTIHYLFSKNDLFGSKLISWGTKHLSVRRNIPSHVAILVQNRWVHESTAQKGVRVISYDKWKTFNQEIAKVSYPLNNIEYQEIKNIFRSIKDKKYDWLGVIYFGFQVALNKFFHKPIPQENKWDDPNKYFCSEAVEKLTKMTSASMTTPIQLLDSLDGNN